ncbi:GNAT family N-acetyltransferase [Candidatus Obscuribacterales bacterium]|nr:GNAT family N-acetyltransferase [Candidatus Obscuribacterales bacterium]MBX3150849.1 GNAT family N-acetyltransferase [Candidatus Obscuribacterales bacterium]
MDSKAQEILYRTASDKDLHGALTLLDENYRGALADEDVKDGFISVRFSLDEVREMTENGITVVAVSSEETAGVLFAQSCDYNIRKNPLAARMIAVLEGKTVEGKTISAREAIVCGPICISRNFRGQGIMQRMYALLKQEALKNYTIALTLVSQSNQRSIHAHEKLGYAKLASFDSEGRPFDAFAMTLEKLLL